jgi:AcrR family transcriptional regulator
MRVIAHIRYSHFMTELPETLRPRKTPRQLRSVATFDVILEAAARILEAEGQAGLTTNRVAERAGVSVGSLYQYFPSKEAILAELVRRMRAGMAEALRTAALAVRGRPLAEAAEMLLRASIAHHAERPALVRELEHAEALLPLDAETRALKAEIKRVVAGVLAEHGVPAAEQAAFDLSALTRGMVNAAAAAGETDFEAVMNRVRPAVLGYLGIGPAG